MAMSRVCMAFRNKLMVLFLFLFSCSCYPLRAFCQNQCRKGVEGSIMQDISRSLHVVNQPLFLSRREDLEEDVVSLQYAVKAPKLGRGEQLRVGHIEVFDVKRQGFRVEDGKVITASVDLDDAPIWRVAYSCDTDSVFHLYGLPDAEAGFSDLIKELDVTVETEAFALLVQGSFSKLTDLRSIEPELRDELDLMREVLADYRGPRNVDSFSEFWKKCPADIKKQISRPNVSRTPHGFKVTYFKYRRRKISKVSMTIGFDGEIVRCEIRHLFTWPELVGRARMAR